MSRVGHDSLNVRRTLSVGGRDYEYFSLPAAVEAGIGEGARLPYSLKVLLENLLRFEDGKTVIASPHKVYGPQNNDLVLQLRKHKIGSVILGGMSANLCVQAHMHELLEQGFEVAVVRDATAAAILPEGDGYLAAIINFRFMANALWTTEEAVARISASGS